MVKFTQWELTLVYWGGTFNLGYCKWHHHERYRACIWGVYSALLFDIHSRKTQSALLDTAQQLPIVALWLTQPPRMSISGTRCCPLFSFLQSWQLCYGDHTVAAMCPTGYLSHHTTKETWGKKDIVWVHRFRGSSHCMERVQQQEVAGHTVSTLRRQRAKKAGIQLAFPFFNQSGVCGIISHICSTLKSAYLLI